MKIFKIMRKLLIAVAALGMFAAVPAAVYADEAVTPTGQGYLSRAKLLSIIIKPKSLVKIRLDMPGQGLPVDYGLIKPPVG